MCLCKSLEISKHVCFREFLKNSFFFVLGKQMLKKHKKLIKFQNNNILQDFSEIHKENTTKIKKKRFGIEKLLFVAHA